MTYLSLLLLLAAVALACGLAGAAVGRTAAWVLRLGVTFRRLFLAAGLGGGLAAGSIVAARSLILDPWQAGLVRWAGPALAAVALIAVALAGMQSAAWKRAAAGVLTLLPVAGLIAAFPWVLDPLTLMAFSVAGATLEPPPVADLPPAAEATTGEIRRLERSLPHALARLTVINGTGGHGGFHRTDLALEGRLWSMVRALPVWDGGGARLIETIDRVYLAYHGNAYHGWTWHYPYFDCFKAVALASKARREYRDPAVREAALWRQAYCYRVRGLDGGEYPYREYLERYPSVAAQARWHSDLDRARELLAELVERFPGGAYRAHAQALLDFGFAEIAAPVSFPATAASDEEFQPAPSAEAGDVDIPALRSDLETMVPERRRRALEALGALGTGGAEHAATILPFLDDPMSEVQLAALEALARVAPTPETAAELLRYFEPEQQWHNHWEAARALLAIERRTGEVLPLIVAGFVGGRFDPGRSGNDIRLLIPSADLKRRALRRVAAEVDPPRDRRARLADVLCALAQRPDIPSGAGQRAFDAEAEAEARLRRMLDDPAREVRRAAAGALGALGRPMAPETATRLAGVTVDSDAVVRERVAAALGRTGMIVGTEQLVAALGDPEPAVRIAAAKSLGQSAGAKAVAPLIVMLDDPELEVQVAAISALGALHEIAAPAVDRLTEIVLGDDPDLGSEALFAVELILGFDSPRLHELSAYYGATHGPRVHGGGWLEERRAKQAAAAAAETDPVAAGDVPAAGSTVAFELLRAIPHPAPPDGPGAFGYTLAADAERVAVGDYMNDRVFLIDPRTGELLHVLKGAGDEYFGTGLALDGGRLGVGAARRDGRGGVDLFDAATGRRLRRITPPEGPDSSYGSRLALSEHGLLVTSHLSSRVDRIDPESGTLLGQFESPDPEICPHIGSDLALSGQRVVIGAGGCHGYGVDGRVYVFALGGGEPLLAIDNPSPGSGSTDLFGDDVVVAGGDILVAARQDSTLGEYTGAVYLFDGETGELLLELLNPDPGNASFGVSVAAIGSDLLAVGAPGHNNHEKVYLFDLTGRRHPAIPSAYRSPYVNSSWSFFGQRLAVVPGGELLIVGASTADPAGEVYVFRRVRP